MRLRVLFCVIFFRVTSTPASSQSGFLPRVEDFCHEQFIRDSACCLDTQLAEGVHRRIIRNFDARWECKAEGCLDDLKGIRGDASMWIPDGADCNTPRVLYIHGGGWLHGSPTTQGYPQLASRLANLSGAVVLVPDFPLVPVGNFRTITDSALAALEWLAHNGPHGSCGLPMPPLFLGGDSSGGGTAASVLMEIASHRRLGAAKIAGAFLLSPWLNLKCNTPDYHHNAFSKIVAEDGRSAYVGDVMFTSDPAKNRDLFVGVARTYVGGDERLLTDPIASPFYAELASWDNVPPLYFVIGSSESIMGDSVLFAQKAARKNVEVQLDVFIGMWHVFPMYSEGCGSGQVLWQGAFAQRRIAKFIKHIASTGRPPCSSHRVGPNRKAPFVEFHYSDPENKLGAEWFPLEDSCTDASSDRHTF